MVRKLKRLFLKSKYNLNSYKDYCIKNKDNATTSALLTLLYFGLRQSELSSLRVIDGKYLECETSKERMGINIVCSRKRGSEKQNTINREEST